MSQKQEQLKPFKSKEVLLTDIESNISLVPEALKNAIKYYCVSRYFVAVYESRHQEVPIQVWNEYRNALDHFSRHLIAGGNLESLTGATNHLPKMEGHLLRATLDILKMFSHKTHDYVLTLKKEHDHKILELVDNGMFIKNINNKLRQANRTFEFAKISDSQLGSDIAKNDEVLEMYLDAAFAYDQLQCHINDKAPDIDHAREQHAKIHSHAHKHSYVQGVTIHLMTYAIMAIGSFLLGIYLPDIKQKYAELRSHITVLNEKTLNAPPVTTQNNLLNKHIE